MRTILIVFFSICTIIRTIASSDTLSLPAVNILAIGWQSYIQDRRVERIDTLLLINNFTNLKEILPILGIAYCKDYGPGNSATYTYQGTAAQHNQIIWNGIPINSSLLGLTDLSLASVQAFQQLRIIRGTSSDYWGSGAIGSTILIDNKSWDVNRISFDASYNSLHNQNYNLTANYVFKNLSMIVSGSILNNLNSYKVLDYTSPKQEFKLFETPQMSKELQCSAIYKYGKYDQFKLHFWTFNSDRNISPSLTEVNHNAMQNDNTLRAVIDWIHVKEDFNFKFLTGLIHESIKFQDDAVKDTGLVTSIFLQANAEKRLENISISLSFQSRFDIANNSSFNVTHDRYINSLAINISKEINSKTHAFLNSRSEILNKDKFIQVGSIGIMSTFKEVFLKTYLATSYNIPTFNDLYWIPGGNEFLKPERGINAGIDLEYEKKIGELNNSFGLNLFYHNIKDWIQWIPGNPYWKPVNYKKVESMGANIFWNTKIALGKSQLSFLNSFQLTQAINKEVSENSGSIVINKQLSYVPEYSFQNSIIYRATKLQIAYYQQWVGKRYTTSDESSFLEPYLISTIQISYSLIKNDFIAKPYFAINNIFDTRYETVAYRPREPRNLSIGINVQFGKFKERE